MHFLVRFIFVLLLALGVQAHVDAAPHTQTRHKAKLVHARAMSYAKNASAIALADSIAKTEGLDPAWVRVQLRDAKFLPQVVQLMQPAPVGSKKNWTAYRNRFVMPLHIARGVAFWRNNQSALLRAQQEYGVPPYIILGILGVETIYGHNTGSFRVLDALATLALDYPVQHPRRDARTEYFRNELAQFLLLAKQMHRDPKSYKGSYAGAMGWPQFMPSSWMKYAVDFDGDSKTDLWQSPSDIVGSIASYFKAYGWKQSAQPMGTVELENGADAPTPYPVDSNFFVITKYNDSYYYAAAVLELGYAIEAEISNDKKNY